MEQFLYINGRIHHTSIVPRLTGEFHGSGCSLASHIAGRLAMGDDIIDAITAADAWIHQTLIHADLTNLIIPSLSQTVLFNQPNA